MPVVNREWVLYVDDPEALRRRRRLGRDAPKNFGRKGFHKITTYTSTTEDFSALLPDYMIGVMGFDDVRGKNQGEVNKAFKKAVREYTVRVPCYRGSDLVERDVDKVGTSAFEWN